MEGVSRRETESLNLDIGAEQKADVYAFALNDNIKSILRFAAATTFFARLVKKPFSFAIGAKPSAAQSPQPDWLFPDRNEPHPVGAKAKGNLAKVHTPKQGLFSRVMD